MREALGAATAGALILVGGLAARRTTSAPLQSVGQVLVLGGAIVLVIGCLLLVRRWGRRRGL